MDIEVATITEFRRNIKPCREIKVYRDGIIPYYHHMLVTRVYEDYCEIIHNGFTKAIDFLKCKYPAAISRLQFVYDKYDISDVKKIFNFDDGDKVVIVNRSDYPKKKKDIECVINRAESRLSERKYSAYSNNCEAFINWVFSGENVSKQIQGSGEMNRAVADCIDSNLTYGAANNYSNAVTSGVNEVITKNTNSSITEDVVKESSEVGTIAQNMRRNTDSKIVVEETVSTQTAETFSKEVPKCGGKVINQAVKPHLSPTIIHSRTPDFLKPFETGPDVTVMMTQKMPGNSYSFQSTTQTAKVFGEEVSKINGKVINQAVKQNPSPLLVNSGTPDFLKQFERGPDVKEIITHKIAGKSYSLEVSPQMAKSIRERVSGVGKDVTTTTTKKAAKRTVSSAIKKKTTSVAHGVKNQSAKQIKSVKGARTSKLNGAGKIKNTSNIQNIKQNITKSGVAISCAVEAVFLIKSIYDIVNDEHVEKRDKERAIVRQVGSSAGSIPGSVFGGAIGQTLIPIPFIGGVIGGMIGGSLGGTVVGVISGAAFDKVRKEEEKIPIVRVFSGASLDNDDDDEEEEEDDDDEDEYQNRTL